MFAPAFGQGQTAFGPPFMHPPGARTRYHYYTPDGLPPNAGEVPRPDPFPPFPGMSPIGSPMGPMGAMPGMFPFGVGPMGVPPWLPYNGPKPPEPNKKPPEHLRPPTEKKKCLQPPTPPPSSSGCCSGHRRRPTHHYEPPRCEDADEAHQDNHVHGLVAKFPDNYSGHAQADHNAVFHVFTDNIVTKFGNTDSHTIHVPKPHQKKFTVQSVSVDMTVAELIIQIECKKRANWHPPYNTGAGYPEHAIGIQEVLEHRDGQFVLGTKITLTSPRAQWKISEVWPDASGHHGSPPRWLVRFPV